MTDLVEFIKVRIVEDRARAARDLESCFRAIARGTSEGWAAICGSYATATLARCDALDALAEEFAKSRFVAYLRLLAAAWSSHPDYRQEWVRNGS